MSKRDPYQLAQVNIARMRADLSDPVMAGLRSRLDEVNELAERSEGFVWRLRGDEISFDDLAPFKTYFVPFLQPCLFYNLSVWESVETLKHFVVNTVHAEMLRDRNKWMDSFNRTSLALWWVPAGHKPSIQESLERLRSVDENGPTAFAFTFSRIFERS
jgi:hypothetical protein